MYLPPKHHIPALEDPIAYYYIPVLRSFFIKRLTLCLDLLPSGPIPRLLDIGCGTGIILPELTHRATEIWAIDNQLQERSLLGLLQMEKIQVHVAAADLLHLPFQDGYFDVVLLISILEHIADLEAATQELNRVLKPGGILIAGFPTKNKLTDKLLGGSTGFHVSTHRQILNALQRLFVSLKVAHFPGVVPRDYSLYIACQGTKKR